jgi:hypothetical protein
VEHLADARRVQPREFGESLEMCVIDSGEDAADVERHHLPVTHG